MALASFFVLFLSFTLPFSVSSSSSASFCFLFRGFDDGQYDLSGIRCSSALSYCGLSCLRSNNSSSAAAAIPTSCFLSQIFDDGRFLINAVDCAAASDCSAVCRFPPSILPSPPDLIHVPPPSWNSQGAATEDNSEDVEALDLPP